MGIKYQLHRGRKADCRPFKLGRSSVGWESLTPKTAHTRCRLSPHHTHTSQQKNVRALRCLEHRAVCQVFKASLCYRWQSSVATRLSRCLSGLLCRKICLQKKPGPRCSNTDDTQAAEAVPAMQRHRLGSRANTKLQPGGSVLPKCRPH